MSKNDSANNRKKWSPAWTGGVLIALTGAIVASAWFLKPGLNWIITVGLMTLFLAILGQGLVHRPAGVLVNELRIMSLSRFQMALWTVIILSGYLVIAIARIKEGDVADPLAVKIDWQVWALLGISATSLVGSPLIGGTKKQKKPDPKAVKDAGAPFGDKPKDVEGLRQGLQYPNKHVSEAHFTDMFEGEELADASLIDMAKVQMFFFTVIVAVAFSAELLHIIMVDDLTVDDISLPAIHEGLLTLMGLSNAGYLGSKGIARTATAT